MVKVRVALAPKLAAQVPAGAPLFVLVRSSEGAGPPLAVTRRTSAELPLLVQLTDRDAMIAGRGLGTSGEVTVVARIAKSGQPTASTGDLEGRVSYDLAHPNVVDLVIDTIVPEPAGGAHTDSRYAALQLRNHLLAALSDLRRRPAHRLVDDRYAKFRRMGQHSPPWRDLLTQEVEDLRHTVERAFEGAVEGVRDRWPRPSAERTDLSRLPHHDGEEQSSGR